MVRFDEGFERYLPLATYDDDFPYHVPMLAPFWSKIDIYGSFCSDSQLDCVFGEVNRSAVFYQEYTEDSPNASYILDRASQDVRNNSEFSSFKASWVLVVTWVRLRPEEELDGDAEEGIVSPPK